MFFITDSSEDFLCSSPPTVPNSKVQVLEGFETLESALPGTILRIQCMAMYRNDEAPCHTVTTLECINGKWVGQLPNCGEYPSTHRHVAYGTKISFLLEFHTFFCRHSIVPALLIRAWCPILLFPAILFFVTHILHYFIVILL